MRRVLLPLTLTSVAVLTALGAGPAVASAPSSGTTTIEKGYVIECTGTLRGQAVNATLYENDPYTNVVAVNVGDVGSSSEPADVIRGRHARAKVRLDGGAARISGTVRIVGAKTPVHEDLEDNEQHIVSVGWHRKLKTRLTLSYKGATARLACGNAFRYRLRVTKTPVG